MISTIVVSQVMQFSLKRDWCSKCCIDSLCIYPISIFYSVVHQTEIQPPLTKLSIDKYINGEDVCLYKMTKYGQKKVAIIFWEIKQNLLVESIN